MRRLLLLPLALVFSLTAIAHLSAITGATTICNGQTTFLNNSTPGGAWHTTDTSVVSLYNGEVHGIAAGQAVITYTMDGSIVTTTVTVLPAPSPIYGERVLHAIAIVSNGQQVTLHDTTPGGGYWSAGSLGDVRLISSTPDSVTIMLDSNGSYSQVWFESRVTGCATGITVTPATQPLISIPGNSEVKMFPNPASNTLTIETTDSIDEIAISNLRQQIMVAQNLNGRKTVGIDIAGLPAGIYFARINQSQVSRFVKR